ncbi:hypothetical protein HID58_032219 [Brassica napus]|uniref:Uncharacterized protein n=1 Tax=Brassica napus TaxID=3708 RepID=A0ABQ8BVW0_BRANA|nr:hypothetical protein HID58_032219 [Brassica napus]
MKRAPGMYQLRVTFVAYTWQHQDGKIQTLASMLNMVEDGMSSGMQDVAHLGCARSRRDDLESSDVYINISDAGNLGRLSWQEFFLADYSLATCKEHAGSVLSIYVTLLTQDDKIFCGLGMRNNIGHNKVNVEKRCSNH